MCYRQWLNRSDLKLAAKPLQGTSAPNSILTRTSLPSLRRLEIQTEVRHYPRRISASESKVEMMHTHTHIYIYIYTKGSVGDCPIQEKRAGAPNYAFRILFSCLKYFPCQKTESGTPGKLGPRIQYKPIQRYFPALYVASGSIHSQTAPPQT